MAIPIETSRDIAEEIADIVQDQNKVSDETGPSKVTDPLPRVQLIFRGDLSLMVGRKDAIVDALAGLLRISPEAIEVYRIYEGSVVFELGIPSAAVQRLRSLLQSNNAQLRLLNVEKVIIGEKSGQQVEEWVVEVGKFYLVSAHKKSQRAEGSMSQPQQNDIRRLIDKHHKRLLRLKEQQAEQGISTPPEVSNEIEKIEVEKARLRAELDTLIAEEQISSEEQLPSVDTQTKPKTGDESRTNQVEILLRDELVDGAAGFSFASTLANYILNINEAELRVLEACGRTIRLELPTDAVKKVIGAYSAKEQAIQNAGIEQVKLLLKFRNREKLCKCILESEANHIELCGPGRVGKSYLLHHITQGYEGVRSVYINLATHCEKTEVQTEIMRQLTGIEPQEPFQFRDFAKALENFRKGDVGQPFNHVVFIFDSAKNDDKNHQKLIKWLISQEGLINNEELFSAFEYLDSLRDVKLQVIIAVRRPMVEIEDYHDNLSFEPIRIDHLTEKPTKKEDAVYLMLKELAEYHGQEITKQLQKNISNIYYITGGHPKCVQSVLFAIADARFMPMKNDWKRFFEQHVFPTIQEELSTQIPAELLPPFEILSIFRRFDRPLLDTLLERHILSSPLLEQAVIEQARDLRRRLVETYLVNEPSIDETMYTMNFTIRRVLSLNMMYNDPARYLEFNKIALDIFTERLTSTRMSPSRSIISLMEIVYHLLKILEVDSKVKPKNVCGRTKTKLDNLLPLLLNTIDVDDLPRLRSYWGADKELLETIQRVTGGHTCYKNLSRRINDFITTNVRR